MGTNESDCNGECPEHCPTHQKAIIEAPRKRGDRFSLELDEVDAPDVPPAGASSSGGSAQWAPPASSTVKTTVGSGATSQPMDSFTKFGRHWSCCVLATFLAGLLTAILLVWLTGNLPEGTCSSCEQPAAIQVADENTLTDLNENGLTDGEQNLLDMAGDEIAELKEDVERRKNGHVVMQTRHTEEVGELNEQIADLMADINSCVATVTKMVLEMQEMEVIGRGSAFVNYGHPCFNGHVEFDELWPEVLQAAEERDVFYRLLEDGFSNPAGDACVNVAVDNNALANFGNVVVQCYSGADELDDVQPICGNCAAEHPPVSAPRAAPNPSRVPMFTGSPSD